MKADSESESEKKFEGVYGHWELLIAGVILMGIAILDVLYLQLYLFTDEKNVNVFSAAMINSLGLFLLGLPYASKRIETAENWLSDFMALPMKDMPVTFPVVSGFLGEQALGGFLGSVAILSTRQAFNFFGAAFAGFFCFSIIAISIVVTTLSLLRFVVFFARFSWKIYGFVSVLSFLVMFSFYWAGVKSVSSEPQKIAGECNIAHVIVVTQPASMLPSVGAA